MSHRTLESIPVALARLTSGDFFSKSNIFSALTVAIRHPKDSQGTFWLSAGYSK